MNLLRKLLCAMLGHAGKLDDPSRGICSSYTCTRCGWFFPGVEWPDPPDNGPQGGLRLVA